MNETTIPRVPLVGNPLAKGLRVASKDPREFDAPKISLIIAAETLFAEQSLEKVSLREIARAAGNGNNNAVQYHFGDKAGLIQAIFGYRVWQMDEPRRIGLNALEGAGRESDIAALLELLLLPLLDLTNARGQHAYAAFIGKYLLRSRPSGLRHAMDSLTDTTLALRRINSAIELRLAHLPPDLVISRIAIVYLMFVNMLVRSDNDGLSLAGGTEFQARIQDCVAMAAASLLTPAPTARK
jgi:AcrR family transcriptional regulator